MRRFRTRWLVATFCGALALPIAAQIEPATGFLPPAYLNLIDVLPPAPIAQEPKGMADQAVYTLTRSLKGTPRWEMAVSDAATDTRSMMQGFSCAARIGLTPANAPATAALLARATRDTIAAINDVNKFYKRKRPYLTSPGEICIARDDALDGSYDYPSDHAARGWTWALILAEAEDDRAAAILARGRAFGESRVVCGVHNMSSVEAGRMAASATMAVVRTEPDYQDAVAAARKELAGLRKMGRAPSAQACAAEEAVVGQPIFR